MLWPPTHFLVHLLSVKYIRNGPHLILHCSQVLSGKVSSLNPLKIWTVTETCQQWQAGTRALIMRQWQETPVKLQICSQPVFGKGDPFWCAFFTVLSGQGPGQEPDACTAGRCWQPCSLSVPAPQHMAPPRTDLGKQSWLHWSYLLWRWSKTAAKSLRIPFFPCKYLPRQEGEAKEATESSNKKEYDIFHLFH